MAMMDDDKDFGRTPDLNADAPGRRRGGNKSQQGEQNQRTFPLKHL